MRKKYGFSSSPDYRMLGVLGDVYQSLGGPAHAGLYGPRKRNMYDF